MKTARMRMPVKDCGFVHLLRDGQRDTTERYFKAVYFIKRKRFTYFIALE